ncbi:hypothetical protein CRUP_020150 [Coryphaenoides rupestris]|nr:hypothetical protein CRUP_020150 [Coryphaenoides rupestris]
MKTSKPRAQSSTQEQCGVWLDTVELKAKFKKKQRFRPISKLLNPLAGGSGYSLAVALNFTQTKIVMPNTKQSSLSTFFTGQRRVLSKMSTSEDPHIHPTATSITTQDSSTSSTTVAPGTKRKHDMVDRISGVESQVKVARMDSPYKGPTTYEWTGQSVQDGKDAACHEYKRHATLQHQCPEQKAEELLSDPERMEGLERVGRGPHTAEPGEKSPLSNACSSQVIHEPVDAAENEKPDYITHDSQSHVDPCHQEGFTLGQCRDTGTDFLESFVESGFGIGLGSVDRTSTQKPPEHTCLPQLNEEKDEYSLTGSQPPREHSSHASTTPQPLDKWTEPKTSSQCRRESDQGGRAKTNSLRNNHLVRDPRWSVHGDTLDMLFTQDSEGFRVIAHRGGPPPAPRTPLKDHTNLGLAREKGTVAQKNPLAYNEEEEEEEEEMLFTQDSQGNVVIKH